MITINDVKWRDDTNPTSMKTAAREKMLSWFHGAEATVLQLWDSHDREPTYYAVVYLERSLEIQCVRLFSLRGAGYEISVDSTVRMSRPALLIG